MTPMSGRSSSFYFSLDNFHFHRIDRWIFKSYGLKESCNLSELVPLDAEVPQLLKRAGDSVNPNVPVALFRKKSRLSIFGLFLLEVPRVSFYGRDSRSPYLVHDSADTEEWNSVIVGVSRIDTVYFDLSRRVYIFPIVQVESHVRDFAGGVAGRTGGLLSDIRPIVLPA